jgi:MoxR-like ATPase
MTQEERQALDELRPEMRRNLSSAGIKDKTLQDSFIPVPTMGGRSLESRLYSALGDGFNVLILGRSGWGKTAIMNQIAEKLNMAVQPLSTASLPPEVFSGRPLAVTKRFSTNQKEARLTRIMKERQLRLNIKDESEKAEKEGKPLSKAQLDMMWRLGLENLPDLTKELQEELEKQLADDHSMDMTEVQESFLKSDWVRKAEGLWDKGVKTILFLDEMNQGQLDTLNAIFPLINEKVFANRYPLADFLLVTAAGNLFYENNTLSRLSDPLVRRFDVKIYYVGNWADAFAHLRAKYSHNSQLVILLITLETECVGDDGKWEDFHSPADLESTIKRLAIAMERGTYKDVFDVYGNTSGSAFPYIEKFVEHNNLNDPTRKGGPLEGQSSTASNAQQFTITKGPITDQAARIKQLKELWKKFARQGVFPITDPQQGQRALYRWADRQDFLDYLKQQPEYEDVPLDVWNTLEGMDLSTAANTNKPK